MSLTYEDAALMKYGFAVLTEQSFSIVFLANK